MNLKENKKGEMRGFGERKGKEEMNVIIISKIKKI